VAITRNVIIRQIKDERDLTYEFQINKKNFIFNYLKFYKIWSTDTGL